MHRWNRRLVFMMTILFVSSGILSVILFSKDISDRTSALLRQETLQTIRPELKDYSNLTLCPEKPPALCNYVQPEVHWKAYEENPSVLQHVQLGGSYKPRDCRARENVAIIVPYRDREEHLRKLLVHLHQFLPKQKISYRIFVAEMAQGTTFNTGIMQNVGFQLADKTDNFTCFIIHDVDLLPTNENNLYKCDKVPVHIATNNSKYNYSTFYQGYFGGVIALKRDMYYKANGFNNLYFGWGGQDDDFRTRLIRVGLSPRENPMNIGVYKAIPHENDPGNPINHGRSRFYKTTVARMKTEGLNSLQYKLLKQENRDWYTWVLAEVNKTQVLMKYEH